MPIILLFLKAVLLLSTIILLGSRIAGCFLYRAWESILIGMIGAGIASATSPLFDKLRIDDPVGASAVHGACGVWGVIAVGLFADNPIPMDTTNGRSGLFKGGGWYLLGVQALTALCLATWALVVTMALLWVIDKIMPIRMDPYEELLGADLTEHRIRHGQVGVSRAVSALRPYHRSSSIEEVGGIGVNTGHNLVVDKLFEAHLNKKKNRSRSIGNLQTFTNRGFSPETEIKPTFSMQNGFLNKRPGNPENDLHRTLDAMADEINGVNYQKNEQRRFRNAKSAESVKGKRLKELSVTELEELGEMNASEDRFRHRFNDDDYKNDLRRANLSWID